MIAGPAPLAPDRSATEGAQRAGQPRIPGRGTVIKGRGRPRRLPGGSASPWMPLWWRISGPSCPRCKPPRLRSPSSKLVGDSDLPGSMQYPIASRLAHAPTRRLLPSLVLLPYRVSMGFQRILEYRAGVPVARQQAVSGAPGCSRKSRLQPGGLPDPSRRLERYGLVSIQPKGRFEGSSCITTTGWSGCSTR